MLRGIAILTGTALLATLVLVTIANARAFSDGSVHRADHFAPDLGDPASSPPPLDWHGP